MKTKKKKDSCHRWICLRHFYWMPKRLGGRTWEASDGEIEGDGKTAKEAILVYLKKIGKNI